MLTITKSQESVGVRGSAPEMMLFHCVWQGDQWALWFDHGSLGKEDNSGLSKEMGMVVNNCKEGEQVNYNITHKNASDAVTKAISVCRAVGIVVSDLRV